MIQMESDQGLDWIGILNENTEVDFVNLNTVVKEKSFKPREEPLFFGKALKDESSTIIHHFAEPGLLYPDLEAGVFLSRKLVMELWQSVKDQDSLRTNDDFPSDFNIDPAYEFAKYLASQGIHLQNIPHICTTKAAGCITYSRRADYSCTKKSDTAGLKSMLEKTYVAVKTCGKYHEDRLKVRLLIG